MAKFYQKITLLFSLLCCLGIVAAWAENPFSVSGPGLQLKLVSGDNSISYYNDLGFVQRWNGAAFVIETKVCFAQVGKFNNSNYDSDYSFPFEGHYGFFLKDTVNKHKYIIGPYNFNPPNTTWSHNPANIPLGMVFYEKGSEWKKQPFMDPDSPDPDKPQYLTVPKADGYVRLRVEYMPGGKLAVSYARPGGGWHQIYDRYKDPAFPLPDKPISIDRIGFTVDAYGVASGLGPVSFSYFKVSGNGPATTTYFTPTCDLSGWEVIGNPLRVEYFLDGDPLPAPTSLSVGVRLEKNDWATQLTWTKPDSDETVGSYKIVRKAPGDAWQTIASVPGNVTSYVDSGANKQIAYVYRVSAVYDLDRDPVVGSFSNEVSVVPAAQ